MRGNVERGSEEKGLKEIVEGEAHAQLNVNYTKRCFTFFFLISLKLVVERMKKGEKSDEVEGRANI